MGLPLKMLWIGSAKPCAPRWPTGPKRSLETSPRSRIAVIAGTRFSPLAALLVLRIPGLERIASRNRKRVLSIPLDTGSALCGFSRWLRLGFRGSFGAISGFFCGQDPGSDDRCAI